MPTARCCFKVIGTAGARTIHSWVECNTGIALSQCNGRPTQVCNCPPGYEPNWELPNAAEGGGGGPGGGPGGSGSPSGGTGGSFLESSPPISGYAPPSFRPPSSGGYTPQSFRPPQACSCPRGWVKIGSHCCRGANCQPCVSFVPPMIKGKCYFQRGCVRGQPCASTAPRIPVPCYDYRCNVGPCESDPRRIL